MIFSKKGPENTAKTIELALKVARERDIEHIVVASNTGDTAMLLQNSGKKIVCVTHAYGYKGKGENELSAEAREGLRQAGIEIVTASHVLSGVERGISGHSKGMYPAEIMANTLRMFGHGMKVCVEISIMALDAGTIPYGKKIIAIGGTGRGADTAAILTPEHAQEVLGTKIHEIICKPE